MARRNKRSKKELLRKLKRLKRDITNASSTDDSSSSSSYSSSDSEEPVGQRIPTEPPVGQQLPADPPVGQQLSADPPVGQQPPTNPSVEQARIGDEIMSLLDDGQSSNAQEGPEFREEVVNRWEKVLKEGLEKEKRKSILGKYPTCKNLQLAKAPELNKEIQSSIPELAAKQDAFLCQVQNHISSVLTAIGVPINHIIVQGAPPGEDNAVLQNLIDAGRLLTDLHHSMSKHRRYLIGPLLNNDLKKVIAESPITTYLFGDELCDRIKKEQSMKEAGVKLFKQKKIVASTSHQNLNFKRGANRERLKWPEQKKPSQKEYKGKPHHQRHSRFKRTERYRK